MSTQSSLARVAMIIALKNSKDIMFLFRLSRGKLGQEQKDFYDGTVQIAKASTIDELNDVTNKFKDRVATKFNELKKQKEAD